MSWPPDVIETIKRLDGIKGRLQQLFAQREQAIQLLTLATVCQEHLLLVGPPGTAKTEIIHRYTSMLDLKGFNYLLTRFTEPSELFGPLDLKQFQDGVYHIRTDGMLPEAQMAFLDEVFQGSSAILNSLLTLINERLFHNGSVEQKVPLICVIGASNSVPEDPSLRAFADRFVIRLELNQVEDDLVDNLLDLGWDLETERIKETVREFKGEPGARIMPLVKSQDVLKLHSRLLEVGLGNIRPEYSKVIRELRSEGLELSDRRAIKGLKLVAGAALLRKADTATLEDLWPLLHLWTRPEEADVIKTVIQPRLEEAGVTMQNTTRPVIDILMDLETIEKQAPAITSETAFSAHLAALGRLRRELMKDHPKEIQAYRRIEEVIRSVLDRMEKTYV